MFFVFFIQCGFATLLNLLLTSYANTCLRLPHIISYSHRSTHHLCHETQYGNDCSLPTSVSHCQTHYFKNVPVNVRTQLFSPKALLTRGVPDLQLDPFPRLDLHQPGEEVHADGGVGHLGEAALREPPDQTGLPHRGVPDDDQPELIEPYRLHDLASPVCRS